MPSSISARRADYVCNTTRKSGPIIRIDPVQLEICSAANLEALGDIRGHLRKLKHSKQFLEGIFDNRDKQLFPRDILVASIPSRRRAKREAEIPTGGEQAEAGGTETGSTGRRRAVGILRRSFNFDKVANRRLVHIDFVWVIPEFRGQHIGRRLLEEGIVLGKQKQVRLQVAGNEANVAAVRLYESIGFRRDPCATLKGGMLEMVLDAPQTVTCRSTPLPMARVSMARVHVGLQLDVVKCGAQAQGAQVCIRFLIVKRGSTLT
eukprot:CAMPEP_0119314632 /NCGR_PEP_ID=MMETSP1333-20130426/33436_1 /TAXON_ID=418940 /ORGANISM="Scyphosphaera apsteinii, Strain RCC1455" /LENGTH=262 /DNA_ID=CAMNT_0007319783 /DNA_START=30 /DNA_END=818 /DNA_ORIENTATION=-